MKKGDILNINGFAVKVGATPKDPLVYGVEIVKNEIFIIRGIAVEEQTLLDYLDQMFEAIITHHNESRHIPTYTCKDESEVTILGKPYTIVWESVPPEEYDLEPYIEGSDLFIPMYKPTVAKAKKKFDDYLYQRANTYIRNRYYYWRKKTNFYPYFFDIQTTKDTWACYIKTHAMMIVNPILMTQDRDFINEVIVHELVHMVHFDHSPEFYQQLEQFLPKFREVTPPKLVPTLPYLKFDKGKLVYVK